MFNRLLIGTALSGLLIPAFAHAESAAPGPTPSSSQLQHPSLLAPSAASQFMPFQPRINVSGALGSDRSLAVTEGWAPLWQDDFHVFYGDIRAMLDDGNNEEYNLGFGYRALRGSQIGGLHAWLDKRDTALGNSYYQATLGAELLTLDTDFRANIYIPFTRANHYITPNIGSSTPYLAGSSILYDTTGFFVEEAQKGVDLEAGYRLPVMQQYIDAFRVYGGGYAFLGNETDDVVGLRTRAQVDVNPWLSVGARLQRDDERGTQGFIEATLRFPVSSKKMIQRDGVRARMDESPERDVDIVTGAKQVDTGLAKPVINTQTGQAQRVLYVDNSNGAGNGTKENPYNNLKEAEANLQTGDILYIYHGDGTTTGQNNGIVIGKDNVSIIGSGVNFVYDAGKYRAGGAGTDFSGTLLMAAGAAPVITNTDPFTGPTETGAGIFVRGDNIDISGVAVNDAQGVGIYVSPDASSIDSVRISHVTLDNNRYGVYVTALPDHHLGNVSISNANVSNSRQFGIAVQSAGGIIDTVDIRHIVSHDNFYDGVRVAAVTDGGTVKNTTIQDVKAYDNSRYGVNILANNGGDMDSVVLRDIIAYGNTNNGIYAASQHESLLSSITGSNLVTHDNSSAGIFISASSDGAIGDASLTDVTSYSNTSYGVNFVFQSAFDNASLTHSHIYSNTTEGIRLTVGAGGNGTTYLEDVTSELNGTHGMALAQTAGTMDLTIMDSSFSHNSQYGLYLNVGTAATELDAAISGTTVTGNGSTSSHFGVNLARAGTTSIVAIDLGGGGRSDGQNRIYGNSALGKDLRAGLGGITLKAENNWWGVNTGLAAGRRTVAGGTIIDAVPYLTSDPGP